MSDKRRYRQFDEWPNLEVANCAGVLNVADLDHYAKAWHAACERRSITPPLGVINADNRPESV